MKYSNKPVLGLNQHQDLKVLTEGFYTMGNGAGNAGWSTGPRLSRTVSLKDWQDQAPRGQVLPYAHEAIISATLTVCKC